MPTRGRQRWAALAVECFRNQTYSEKHLIIIDDLDDPSFGEDIEDEQITRLVMPLRKKIGEKRNIGVQAASGEFIWHLDSDDWSDPRRMAEQVATLEWSEKSVIGYTSMLFHHPDSDKWGKYVGHSGMGLGTSLLYKREWALRHPFADHLLVGEDNDFVHVAVAMNEYYGVEAIDRMVARAHDDNTSAKAMHQYRPINPSIIPSGYPR